MTPLKDDLQLITVTAVAAAELAEAERTKGLVIERKPGGSPVTSADLAVDRFLKDRLLTARADYGWLSEETPDTPARLLTRRQFVVDPIDGTLSFMKGLPLWCVPIAVVEDGQPVAAVVHVPSAHETYTATAGGGAFLNGKPIQAAATDRLEGARILAKPGLFRQPVWTQPWPELQLEMRSALAYRLALVAAGRFDATLALTPKWDWDVCAGALLATEAGARVTDHHGQPWLFNQINPRQTSLVCATAGLHPLIIARTAAIALPA